MTAPLANHARSAAAGNVAVFYAGVDTGVAPDMLEPKGVGTCSGLTV